MAFADGDPVVFIAAVTPAGRREDALRLDALFRDVTGFAPRLWPTGIVGYGRYEFAYPSGRSGAWLATGFAPRRAQMVLHILPGYADFEAILAALGPVRRGKACFYLPRLHRLDEAALVRLIRAGLDDLARHWTVQPT